MLGRRHPGFGPGAVVHIRENSRINFHPKGEIRFW